MRQLFIKQKLFSLKDKFTVKDRNGNDAYYVEGSLLKIPKTFTIMNTSNEEVATITKKTISLLPTFYVDVPGHDVVTIKKDFTLLKPRYTIEAKNIEVQGNILDMNFEIYQNRTLVGAVSKDWFTWGDSYKVQIVDEELETIIIALVIAIDFVKARREAAASASW